MKKKILLVGGGDQAQLLLRGDCMRDYGLYYARDLFDAIKVFPDVEGEIDLVLCDPDYLKIDPLNFRNEIAYYCSNLAFLTASPEKIEGTGCSVLTKPFGPKKLREFVQKILGK